MSRIRCHVSLVTCNTCHLSLTPTPTFTNPPPANSHSRHSWFATEKSLKQQNLKISDTLFDQKSPVHHKAGIQTWTGDRQKMQPIDFKLKNQSGKLLEYGSYAQITNTNICSICRTCMRAFQRFWRKIINQVLN